MPNAYAQVALTYVHRRRPSIVLWLLVTAPCALSTAIVIAGKEKPSSCRVAIMCDAHRMAVFLLGGAHPRAVCRLVIRLTPGFRRAHVTVAATVIFVVTVRARLDLHGLSA